MKTAVFCIMSVAQRAKSSQHSMTFRDVLSYWQPQTVFQKGACMDLIGRHIHLRDWAEADLAPLAYWMQPGQRWQQLDAPYYPKPTAEQIPAIIERRQMQIEAGTLPEPRREAVIADLADDAILGSVVWYWESEATLWLSIGIVIYDPARWGQGLGYEALGLWTDYVFATKPEIVRVDLRTWSGNAGMMHLATKLGFLEEARFRHARIVAGQHYDALGYGVLRSEWQSRYPQGFAAHLYHQAT